MAILIEHKKINKKLVFLHDKYYIKIKNTIKICIKDRLYFVKNEDMNTINKMQNASLLWEKL